MGRKAMLVTALAFVAAALLAVPAFGAYGGALSGAYLTWDSVSGLPGQGSSPHAGFTTNTQKCAVCHAVHGASDTGEILLASSAAGACDYCHVNTLSSYTQVYGSDPNNYQGTDYNNAHNFYLDGGGIEQGTRCVSCHQVHAAEEQMTDNAYLTTKLLKGGTDPKFFNGTNYDPEAMAPLSTDSSDTALTKWCARCHFTGLGTPYPYYSTNYNGQTHVMKTADATYSNGSASFSGRVAWKDSTECSSCHSSGYRTAAWPHFTDGVRFLETASDASATAVGATEASADGVCLRCHRGTNGDSGAGIEF